MNNLITVAPDEIREMQQEIAELRREYAALRCALLALVNAVPDIFLDYAAFSVSETNVAAVRAARDKARSLL